MDNASSRVKYSVWSGSTYGIGMNSGATYGNLGSHAMTFQMNNQANRGFHFGDSSHSLAQGAMSLSTDGYMTLANKLRVGGGESDTTTSTGQGIDVVGEITSSGNITATGTYPKLLLNDSQGVARNFSVGTDNETFTIRNETGSANPITISNVNDVTFLEKTFFARTSEAILLDSAHSKTKIGLFGGIGTGAEYIGTSANTVEISGTNINFNGASGSGTPVLQHGGTNIMDASRNLVNIGTYSGSGNMTVAKSTTPIVVFETSATSGQDATLKIRGARTASNTSDIATIFLDNKTSSPYTMAKIIARDPSANHGLGNGQLTLQTSSGGTLSNNIVCIQSNIKFATSGQNRAEITSAGVFNCANDVAAFGTLSDITLKENIKVIENPLDKVKQIRGVNFSYKKDGRKSTGLIAQELEKVLPNAIFNTHELGDDKEIKAIRYGNVVGLLVEAIKEQQEQIEELKAKLEEVA